MRLLLVALLVVLAFAGYRYFAQGGPEAPSLQRAAEQAGQAIQEAGRAIEDKARAVTGSLDVGQEVGGVLGELRAALGNLTDPAKLQEALPNLEALDARLAGLQERVEQLPTTARGTVAGLVEQSLPALRSLSERVGSLQGGEPAKAKLDAIIDRLEGWAKAPA
jgi:hypothetical protein